MKKLKKAMSIVMATTIVLGMASTTVGVLKSTDTYGAITSTEYDKKVFNDFENNDFVATANATNTTVEVSTEQAHTGSKSLKITRNTDNNPWSDSAKVAAMSGKNMDISSYKYVVMYVMTTTDSNDSMWFNVYSPLGASRYNKEEWTNNIDSGAYKFVQNQWTKVVIPIDDNGVEPDTTYYMSMASWGNSNGNCTMYVDDIYFAVDKNDEMLTGEESKDIIDDRPCNTPTVANRFMDCFDPIPITGSLTTNCWGAEKVGPRDQSNGLEDQSMLSYSYWDGGIIKDDVSGKYYMFSSRWSQKESFDGWRGSDAVYAVSDNLYGPYVDKGKLWPQDSDGAGHNVFAFKLSTLDKKYTEGYRYGVVVSDAYKDNNAQNGTIHIAKSIDGPWESVGKMMDANGDDDLSLSNVCIIVRPDGKYQTVNRGGDIFTSDSVAGPWTVKSKGLWNKVQGLPMGNIEDPIMWYSDGQYHIIANKWDTKRAYYMTSEDGYTNWVRHNGLAYTANENFMKYTNGTENNWTNLERPNVYIEDGVVKAMTFACMDVTKDPVTDFGNDNHGSKVVVVPFNSDRLKTFDKSDVFIDPLASRVGINPIGDTTIQSWNYEASRNYGGETFLQLQRSTDVGLFGEGTENDSNHDCKIAFLKYDISQFKNTQIEDANLSLVYLEKAAGNATTDKIQVALSDSNWIEGIGNEALNGSNADNGALTWLNQPTIYFDKNDLANANATSNSFETMDTQVEVKVNVTNLIKKFIKDNPTENIISFAVCETEGGNRLKIGSREGGDGRVPKLSVNASSEKVTTANQEKPTTIQKPTTTQKQTTKVASPKRAVISKVKNLKGRKVKVSIKKIALVKGYEVKYSTKKSMKKSKTIRTKKNTVTIKKLIKKKTYYFKARAYKLNGKKKVYGKWSAVKKVKIRK